MKVYDLDLISPETARLDNALRAIGDEVMRAQDQFAPFNSPHEGYAVIAEELDELWDEVKGNRGREMAAYIEAKQIAAMAVRYMLEILSTPPVREQATG